MPRVATQHPRHKAAQRMAVLTLLLTITLSAALPTAANAQTTPKRQITLNAQGSFSARYDNAVEPHQIALLGFHDSELPPTSPNVLDALHNSLPLQGWRVLSLPPGKTAQQKINRIRAGATYLEDTLSSSVALVSTAEHIEQAMQLAIERQAFISGLVMWKVDIDALDWSKMQALKASRVSLLDVTPNQLDKSARLQRQHQFSLVGFVDDYRQIAISDAVPAASSAKRVRRWLEDEFKK